MHWKGYGMPSSHAQFVAFFSVYTTLWVFLRWDNIAPSCRSMLELISVIRCNHFPLLKRVAVTILSFSGASAISLSRIYLSYHTPKQVLAGNIAGAGLAIFWFCTTSYLRRCDIRMVDRTPWQWIMWAGSFIWMKDMCLDVDLVEHDYNIWKTHSQVGMQKYKAIWLDTKYLRLLTKWLV